MILTEPQIDNHKIIQLVGKKMEFDWKNPKPIGSSGLFIKSFIKKAAVIENIKVDSKCNFEKRAKGLLLYTNFSNKRTLIALPEREILEISIVRGKEEINPTPFYLMWILLKLGIPVLKARYFGLRRSQYSIKQMELHIKTTNYELVLISNGYLFERQLEFFKSLDYGRRLKVVRN